MMRDGVKARSGKQGQTNKLQMVEPNKEHSTIE